MDIESNEDSTVAREESIVQAEDLLRQISEQKDKATGPSNSHGRLSLIDDDVNDERKKAALPHAKMPGSVGYQSRTSTTVSTPRGVPVSPRGSPYSRTSKTLGSTNTGSAGADTAASNANLKPGAQAIGPGGGMAAAGNGVKVPDSAKNTLDKVDQKLAAEGGGGKQRILSMAPATVSERTASQEFQQGKAAVASGHSSAVPPSSVLKQSTLPSNYDRSAVRPGAQSVSAAEAAAAAGLSLARPIANSESTRNMVASGTGDISGVARLQLDNVDVENGEQNASGGGFDEESQSEKFRQNTLYKKRNSKDSEELYPIATPISSKLVTDYDEGGDDTRPRHSSNRNVDLGVDGEEVTAVVATLDDGSTWLRNKKIQFLIGILIVGLIAALVVAFTVGGEDNIQEPGTQTPDDPSDHFYFQVGDNMDGDVSIQYGLSISMNDDGSRLAIADREKVSIYGMQEIEEQETVFDEKSGTESTSIGKALRWKELASPILGIAEVEARDLPSIISLPFRSPLITKISASGEFLALGFPLHDAVVEAEIVVEANATESDGPVSDSAVTNGTATIDAAKTTMKHVGRVEVYRLVVERGESSWEQVGNTLEGIQEEGYFGASMSLSQDGGIIAIGAPGIPRQGGGYAQVFYLNKGTWESRGSSVRGNDLDLSVYSVSLSGDGSSIALGGIPNSEEGAVAKVFKWFAGDWIEQGTGFGRAIGDETSYLAELSADGKIVVVSNYYITDAETNTGAGLDVRAFRWQDNLQDWQQLGSNMHEGFTAQKSGYFITLSRDGTRIGMGDPGRRFGDGAATGHAHIWEFDGSDWVQLGPNIWGEGKCVQSVPSVDFICFLLIIRLTYACLNVLSLPFFLHFQLLVISLDILCQ